MSRFNSAKTRCKYGHALTPENVYLYNRHGHPMRICRRCKAARDAGLIRQDPAKAKTQLDAKAVERLRDAWRDGVTKDDLMRRFSIAHWQLVEAVKGLSRSA